MKPLTCPGCGDVHDDASEKDLEQIGGAEPECGDACICFNCGDVNVITADYAFRPATEAEALEVTRETGRIRHRIIARGLFRPRKQIEAAAGLKEGGE